MNKLEIHRAMIMDLLELIQKTNSDIQTCKDMKEPFMVKQYEHLKARFVKELLEKFKEIELITPEEILKAA